MAIIYMWKKEVWAIAVFYNKIFKCPVVLDDFIRIPLLQPSIPANSPQFRQSDKAHKNGHFWHPKKWTWVSEKKVFPRIHMKIHFLQKTGSKLVNFCLSGPIFILHPAIGGRHPVPCLSTQITERQGTAIVYSIGFASSHRPTTHAGGTSQGTVPA